MIQIDGGKIQEHLGEVVVRSMLGDDTAQNPITLCVDCHRTEHEFQR